MRTNLLRLTPPAVLAARRRRARGLRQRLRTDSADLGPDPASMVAGRHPLLHGGRRPARGAAGRRPRLGALEAARHRRRPRQDPRRDRPGVSPRRARTSPTRTTSRPGSAPAPGSSSTATTPRPTRPRAPRSSRSPTPMPRSRSSTRRRRASGKTEQQDYNGVQLTVSRRRHRGRDRRRLPARRHHPGRRGRDRRQGRRQLRRASTTRRPASTRCPTTRIFTLYADPQRALDLVKSSGDDPADQLKQIEDQLAAMGDGPIDAWGTVTDSSMGFGASAPAADDAPDPTDLLTTLPADSWLAFAASDVGDQIANSIAQFKAGFEAGFEHAAPNLAAQVDPIQVFQDATGLNLEQDLAWIGDVGGFVEGTSIFGLGGGLVDHDRRPGRPPRTRSPRSSRRSASRASSRSTPCAGRLRHPGAGRAARRRRSRSRTTRSSSRPAPTPSTTCSRRRRRSATRTRSRQRRTTSATT